MKCQSISRATPILLANAIAALLAVATPRARAVDVTVAWVHRYGNVVTNLARLSDEKVVRDTAGDVIVAGSINDRTTGTDLLTIKYSGSDGTLLWQHRYNGPSNLDDLPNAVAVDGNANVVVTGRSEDTDGYYDSYTAKYAAADGALLWEKRHRRVANQDEIANAVAVDGRGNVVVAGTSESAFYTAKYAAADGTLLWEKLSEGAGEAGAVAVDAAGNAIATGHSGMWNTADYYTAKYAAADGALLWETTYDGPAGRDDYALALAVDGSGNVVVTGFSSNGDRNSDRDFHTIKYAALDGALLWEVRYDGPAGRGDQPNAVAVDASGNVIVTGSSDAADAAGIDFHRDFYTAKYAAADGELLWEKSYDGPVNLDDWARAVAVDANGNVVVTGFSYNPGLENYTAKYAAADGALLWESSDGGGGALVLDSIGNVVVTGYSHTTKYAAADGSLLWENQYQGPASSEDSPTAVAVDGSGNVVVTGSSTSRETEGLIFAHRLYDFYTAKYSAATGALLWEHRYNGPADANDQPGAMALDGCGNVVVTGYSASVGGSDFYTAKYAAADGALLWEKRYDGPAHSNDEAAALALDGGGNVVVTGRSQRADEGYDFYTAKLAAADGALLWEKRGPSSAEGQVVAVDNSGNVIVTGASYSGANNDCYTAKYAGADGALLWEKIYNGPANGDDGLRAVAVDGNGNVVVTGYSGNSVNSDGYTAKYAAADGALLWEKRDPRFSAQAVAVDGVGNVVVTGGSGDTNNRASYYTAKYAAVDGAPLWDKLGPAGLACSVAVAPGGDVIVTGWTYNSSIDCYTAKYAAVDGTLIWEECYNGPANGEDHVGTPQGLALGPNGMVAIAGSSDGNFRHNLPNSDYATVVYWETLASTSIELIPTGVRLHFPGVPGRSYSIESAPAVTGPWAAIKTPIVPIGDLLEYVDTNPPEGTAFYRTSTP